MADKTTGNIIETLKAAGFDIGGAIASNFKLEEITTAVSNLEKGALDVIKVFGTGREQITAIKASLADAVTSVKLLGGNFETVVGIQKDISDALNRNIILNSEAYDDFYAMTEVTGQNTKTVTSNFKDAGYSIYNVTAQMQKVVDLARSVGVNTKQVSDAVVTNVDKLNQFGFKNGIEGLAKMAAQSSLLKVNMTSVFTKADEFLTPEKAIEAAATLQRLGVTQTELLDPLRLMDLSMNNVEELQNQIVEMTKSFAVFNEETGNFEIPKGVRLQLKEIGSVVGFNYQEISKLAIGAKELDEKMMRIQFPRLETTEEQRQLIASMAEFDKDRGEYVIRYQGEKGETVTKSIAELQEGDLKRLGEISKPVEMIDLAKGQLQSMVQIQGIIEGFRDRIGFAAGATPAAEKSQRAMVELAEALNTALGSEKLSVKGLREGLNTGINDLFQSIKEGDVIGGFGKSLADITGYLGETFDQTLVKTGEALGDLYNSTNPLIKLFADMTKGKEGEGVTIPGVGKVEPQNIEIKLSPNNNLNIGDGANLFGEKNTNTTVNTENKISGDVNLRITIDAPTNIDPARLREAFNDPSVMQKIIESVIRTVNNNGMSGDISPTGVRQKINMQGSY